MRAAKVTTTPFGTDGGEARPESSPGPLSPEPAEPQKWWAVWVLSNAEFTVEDQLRGYGIESFLPCWTEVTQWTDRQKVIRRPLFPGYLFARGDDGPRREILRIAGVIEVLPNSMNPKPVDADEIENIHRILACGLPVKPCPYVTGDPVMIDSGPLAGVKGIVQRTKDGTRVVVQIEMLRRAVSVEIDAKDLEPLKENAKA